MSPRTNTRAIQQLLQAGVAFHVHEYTLDDVDEATFGEAVAAALGVAPERMYKTLVAEVDGRPTVAVVPVSARLSTKDLARATGGKRARLADPADAERWTGYVTGGISPFGQRKRMPVVVDASAPGHETVYVSGGQRGVQVEVRPDDLVRLLEAEVAGIAG